MCDLPVPCACTIEERTIRRREHQERAVMIESIAGRLARSGAITDPEACVLFSLAEREWDDAVHIASPDDPLRSLCGLYGRNLVELPNVGYHGGQECWTCFYHESVVANANAELVTSG